MIFLYRLCNFVNTNWEVLLDLIAILAIIF